MITIVQEDRSTYIDVFVLVARVGRLVRRFVVVRVSGNDGDNGQKNDSDLSDAL